MRKSISGHVQIVASQSFVSHDIQTFVRQVNKREWLPATYLQGGLSFDNESPDLHTSISMLLHITTSAENLQIFFVN